MKTAIWLRIAAVTSLVFAAGHTLGARKSWSPMGETDVLRAMRTVGFETTGVSRTYLDFFLGFGFSLAVYLVLQAFVLWQLATLVSKGSTHLRPMIGAFALASLANAILAWVFILPVAAMFGGAVTVCLTCAFFVAR